jgi:diadenosine tetraphosphate (Ap4A) HIT family hydrolase
MRTTATLVLADDLLTIEMSQECGVPGYLVLRLLPPGATLSGLEAASAARLGATLAAAARAIEQAVDAERVYVLSFCEVAPQLHFHLFPRTRWLLEAYRAATGAGGGPPNGPALFEWARRTFPPGAALPPDVPAGGGLADRLRELLAPGRIT